LIGGEGLSSRGHTGQGGEREEAVAGGFQRTEDQRKSRVIQVVIQDFCTYPWVIV
jgi:hypothetical protein